MDKDIKMCIEKAKEEFFKLKEELGIKKDIENWGNMSVSIVKDRNRYRLMLVYAKAKSKNEVALISSYPIEVSRESIKDKKEFKKAERIIKLFKIIKSYRELKNNCIEFMGDNWG